MSLDELFLWPAGLPILLLAPIVWLTLRLLDRSRARVLATVLGPRWQLLGGEVFHRRRRARLRLASVALLCALLAILQPVWGEEARAGERRGIELVVCLDVSRSMLARDVAPSRLAAAQTAIRALASRTRGDRLALVVFAGEARLAVPATHDVTSFGELVALADEASVARGGTDLGAALDAASVALGVADGRHATVVLITDGEDHEQRGVRAAEQLASRGVVVHCVGVGSTVGSKIAIVGDDAATAEAFLRGRDGEEVVSAMAPASLRTIAEAAGGVFVDAGADPGAVLVELYAEQIVPMAQRSFDAGDRRERGNRYQWPLAFAVMLWLVELAITDRRRSVPSRTVGA